MDQLTKEVIKIIGSKGNKFTMDQLAKEANISKSVLYERFHSKKQMCLASIEQYFKELKIHQLSIVDDETLTIKEKIFNLMTTVPEELKDYHLGMREIGRLTYPEYKDYIAAKFIKSFDITFSVMDEAVRLNKMKPFTRYVIQTAIVNSMQAYNFDHVDYQNSFNELVTIIIDGLWINKTTE